MLNRGHSHQSVTLMKATSDAITKENKSLWVFAEGTRSHGKGLQRFKKGAFYTAIAAQAPIVMICAESYRNETRGWYGKRKPVQVTVLPVVETSGMTVKDLPELMANCHQQMDAAIRNMAIPI